MSAKAKLLMALVIGTLVIGTAAVVAFPTATSARPSTAPGETGSAGAAVAKSAPPVPPVPANFFTGLSPDAILVDPTNNTAFVASEYGSNVTAVSLSTGQPYATISVGAQPYPEAMVLDPTNWTLYVANSGSSNVSVISIAQDDVIASVHVGAGPDALAYNPANLEVYVANGASSSISVISPVTSLPHVVATIPVGADPDGLAVDTATHDVFVATGAGGNISVIDATTNAVLNTTSVGPDPGAFGTIAYDAKSKDVFVANTAASNVTVLGGKNRTAFASVDVGSEPDALVVDDTAKEVFVANLHSNNVSVISTVNETVVGSIPVGTDPGFQGAMALDATRGLLYVGNAGSNNVSVISVASRKVVASIDVGTQPAAAAVDPANGVCFVANYASSNVTLFDLAQATFTASGLPKGATWTITAGAPPVSATSLVGHGKSSATLLLPIANDVKYTVTTSDGYALSKITGPDSPSVTEVSLTAPTPAFHLTFGPVEKVTFDQTGLPTDAKWTVTLTSAGTGGALPLTNSTNGTSLTFRAVKGSWHWHLTTTVTSYVGPVSGAIRVGTHALTKSLKFHEVTAEVLFEEAGLPTGTFWQVNLTGPVNLSLTSTTTSAQADLPAGTYTFTVWNYTTSYHPSPETGTLVIKAPHAAYVVAISYATG